ncbi:MAG: MFS transporter [Gemmatimonadota bacterium]|nr:MFS transporter [Gemmatimonadota bacterium]
MARLYLLFASVYLLEGITEVPFILNVYLKKTLEFSPTQIGQTLFLGGLWFIILKPLIGFMADFWKGFNKRWALLFGLVCSSAGWIVIASARSQAAMTAGVSLKVIAIACLDVIVDGMIVEVSNKRNRSFIQSLVYGCRFGGAVLCSIWAGGKIGGGAAAFIQIYYMFSLLSLLALVPILIYRSRDLEKGGEQETATQEENAGEEKVTFREKIGQLANPSFGWLVALLFLFSLGADTATFFDPIMEERFSGEFLGGIYTALNVGILVGILLFPVLRTRLSMKTLFVISLFGWSLVEISCLGIAEWNGLLIFFFGGIFIAFTSIAILTVAVAMCKMRGIETFAFAFAVSAKNLMDQSSVLIGGYVMDAVGITWLFVISSLCGLLPFLILHKIDFRDV